MNIFKNLFQKNNQKYRVVRLMGGLGNQMFEYAFAKSLEHAIGDDVLFDLSWFTNSKKNIINSKNENKNGVVMRDYELSLFNPDIKIANKRELSKAKRQKIRDDNEYNFNPELLKDKGSALYIGYFQNEKYFKNIEDTIKNDFTFPKIEADDKFNTYWLERIKSSENPVFIHLRRGDYTNLDGWVLPVDYYKDAIKYITDNVKNPTFFVFGQDCEQYISEGFDINVPFEVIGEENSKNGEDWKDIVLMMANRHAIIANSSFSWWAAWLGRANSDGIVVAPTPFVNGHDENICDNWVKIKR